MKSTASIAELPNAPAVYSMYGGQGRSSYVAYVGLASKSLRQRLTQHLIRRDSSVVTGVSAVSLNPDLISRIDWYEHPDFAQHDVLEAAELVAFDVLEPILRSRGAVTERAILLHADTAFHARFSAMFREMPYGSLVLPTLQQALERIAQLESRVDTLEKQLRGR